MPDCSVWLQQCLMYEPNTIYSIVSLYGSLLRPIIEYASVVWKLHYIHHIVRRESWIQRRFVETKMRMRYREVPTNHLMRLLNLQPLDTRLDVADLVFLHKLVNGAIDCSVPLAMINLKLKLLLLLLLLSQLLILFLLLSLLLHCKLQYSLSL